MRIFGKPMHHSGLTLPLGLAFLFPVVTVAQQVPTNAGSLMQQMEQRRSESLPKVPSAVTAPAPAAMNVLPGPTVIVKSIRFVGNRLLGQEQLNSVVQGYLDRPVSFAELQQAAVTIAQAYRDAGWIVRAYLPRQEITDGVVTIQIIEAVFGGTLLEGKPPSRFGLDHLLKRVDAAQEKGQPLNATSVDRALLLLEDLPGILAAGNLQAGPTEGETSLLLKLVDKPLVNGEVSIDNGGGLATGPDRLTGNLSFASPMGIGDQAATTIIHTKGSDYARLGYTLPLGNDGWRVGANASWLRYGVITAEMAALDAHGTSTSQGLEASYPIVRSRLKNLSFTANYDQKNFDNNAGGLVTTAYRIAELALGLNANLIDSLGGGGSSSANLTLVSGKVDLDGSPNQESDAATTRTAGSFNKVRYGLSRLQMLRSDLTASVALSGQFAGKNLDPGEKFYLGGSSGVRAYPASEGGGSDGMMVNMEMRKVFPGNISVAGFYDWGKVRVNHDNDINAPAILNDFSLSGVGISVGWLAPVGMNFKATWSRRIGDNPNPSATGQDQDGTLIQNRFWLQASVAF